MPLVTSAVRLLPSLDDDPIPVNAEIRVKKAQVFW